ncbi:DNA-binding protein [uncultured Salinisphaera sp.]|uniref:helix-turn-helix transcriptional regulator n=1 Tax=uncultured Salinisphaera sp. TaxID=359372 RepID=UPI0032B15407|tara:strand:+ start:525 stop:1046 length:522 start_codon:yes stop_codon:yes gene_type:complete
MEYIFTLKYRLNDHDGDEEALIDRLFEAGCDDALPGVGQAGRLALEFVREANSASEALESAIADVRKAINNVEMVEVLPDYAGLTDIAEHVGMSRQNLRKIATKNGAAFPAEIHEGNPSLWHLSDVLLWLERRGYAVNTVTREISAVAKDLNTALQSRKLSNERARELEALIA